MKKTLLIILIVLIILIGAPLCYLFLSGGEYMDAAAFEHPETLTPGERYTVNPGTQTIGVRFSQGDLNYLLNTETEDGLFQSANAYLEDFGLSLQKAGYRFSGDRLTVDARLLYKNFLPLPVRLEATLTASGSEVSALIESVSLGKWIHLSVTDLSVIRNLDLSYDFTEMHPFLKAARDMTFGENEIRLSVPYPVTWLMEGVVSFPSDYTMIVDLVDPEELDTLLPEFLAYLDGKKEVAAEMLDAFASDPGHFADVKRYALAIGDVSASSTFFRGPGSDYNGLLFPELTEESVTKLKTELLNQYQALYDERTGILSDAYQYLLDGYAEGTIIEKGGNLVYNEKGNPAVTPASVPALEGTEKWLDRESARCILATNCGDYSLRQVPKGNSVTAFVFVTLTGRPVVAYRFTADLFKIKSLSETDYAYLIKSDKTPSYDLGEHTTKR